MIQAISWQLTHSTYGASYLLLNTHIALQDFPQFTDGHEAVSSNYRLWKVQSGKVTKNLKNVLSDVQTSVWQIRAFL